MSFDPNLDSLLKPNLKRKSADYFDDLSYAMHKKAQPNTPDTISLGYPPESTLSPSDSGRTYLSTLPSTPSKPGRRQLFPNDQPLFTNPLPSRPETNHNLTQLDTQIWDFSFENMYQSSDGTMHSLLKQYAKSGSEHPCLLMLWADQHRNAESLPKIEEKYWEMVAIDKNPSEEIFIQNAKEFLGLQIESQKNIHNLQQIQNLLATSKNSVIASIEHPKLDSHTILIDRINEADETIELRDPLTGKAYLASFEEAQEWVSEEEPGTCYFISNQ